MIQNIKAHLKYIYQRLISIDAPSNLWKILNEGDMMMDPGLVGDSDWHVLYMLLSWKFRDGDILYYADTIRRILELNCTNRLTYTLEMNIFDLLFWVAILNNTWYRDLKAKGDITGHLERWRGWDRYIWFYICSLLPSARAPSEFGYYHMFKDKLSASFAWYFSMCNFRGACHSKSYPYVQVQGV